ncbi:MAG TPA: protease modulator HflC [Clostridia bacterium]|nr:protease modulator HflC [Clostridia bacterium]
MTSNKKIVFLTVTVIAIVILVAIVLSNLYIIHPNEYKVVKEFGRIIEVADTPGLRMKVPFIQDVTTLPKQILLYDVPPAEINTLDKKRIMVDYYSMWQITDPEKMLETLRTINGAEARLGDIIYSNIRTELGKLEYGEIINHTIKSRGDADIIVKDRVNDILKANSNGIEVVDIQMKRADLPTSNEESVYKRMISERESKAQEYLSQGDAEATRIQATTNKDVSETLARADAKAKEIIAQGEKEAAKIYNESYGKDTEFFDLYTTLESYRTTINDETVIMFPADSPYIKYIFGK